ncbi:hypothetical protein UP06_32820 [Bradyrhizobium sp. LTSP857]|nr:hypothetical protein UP06_32820 [Bradyrhizobium sp. LTSP857]
MHGIRLKGRFKTNSGWPDELPLFLSDGRKVKVHIDDYLYNLMLLDFEAPSILTGAEEGTAVRNVLMSVHEFDWEKLAAKYGIFGNPITPRVDQEAFNRVLAKIAHAYTVAELGLDNFEAVLPSRILDRTDALRRYVGGGAEYPPPASDNLHEVEIEPRSPDHDWIIVRIRLLAYYATPIYRVVSGRWLDQTEAPTNSEG